MAKWSNEKVADLTRKLADTAIDYKQRCEVLEERWEAACQDAREAEAYAEELEAKIRTYEQRDGMDGAVVSAIRDLLNHHNVPKAAFIDDHVGNAIRQRNIAEAKLAMAVEALETIRFFSGVNVAESDLNHVKDSVNGVAKKALAEIKGDTP